MNTSLLIASVMLFLVGVVVVPRFRRGKTSIEEEPAAHRAHPDRVAYVAEVAKADDDRLSAKEAAEVAEFHDFAVKIGTGEQPLVPAPPAVRRRHVYKPPSPAQLARMRRRMLAPVEAFHRDPLAAPIPDLHVVAEPVLFGDAVERWFSPLLEAAPVSFPALPAEPEPWAIGGFTEEWTAADVARMVAEAKVAAK